jgi:3,4-dihydroxy 2-butanone 4-phosphate synthase / GTP cyclohydrolase II
MIFVRRRQLNNSVLEAICAIRAGEIIVVVDDEGRENEGDLVVAAARCTPKRMAFIIRHTCGIVCAPLTRQHAKRLQLPLMTRVNDSAHGTAFTVSIDARLETTTGISARERSNTVLTLADSESTATDFVRPGHVFPLIARDGGVLTRDGHTEAAVDLCRLASLPPVGVICELMNDDGTVMKGQQVVRFARTHRLRRLLIADLIAYRRSQERALEEITFDDGMNPWGNAYDHALDPLRQKMAFVPSRENC